MKSLLGLFATALILAGAFSEASEQTGRSVSISSPTAGKCHTPPQGPPGPQGPAGISQVSAFGSYAYYDANNVFVNPGDLIQFPNTISSLNISHPNSTDFVVQEAGFYYIHFGVASQADEADPNTMIQLTVNGTVVDAGQFFLRDINELSTLALIIPLQAGDVVQVQNTPEGDGGVAFTQGVGVLGPTTAFFDIIRLAPLVI
ncbi:BclA C-terminal domain-containing protein [Estrella lausannensis]|uniref:Putative secreted protein n=1 Tax=Estrella lausannensis TaxID=483423 RepID=A0A0H5E2Y9_9BACT|nr:hypothetical protein [Estrella lausannensis]CRX37565.1 putative secreted protein [Estrella lausannensis]